MKTLNRINTTRVALKHLTLAVPLSAALWLGAGPSAQAMPPVTDGLVVWLAADAVNPADPNQVRIAGADTFVKQWNDGSGNGKNATQAVTGDQPKYIASGVGGKPVLRFTQVDENVGSQLELGDLSASFPTAGSMFAVSTINTDGRYNLFDNRNNDSRWVANSWNESQPGVFRNGRTGMTYGSWPQTGSHVFAMESSSSLYRFVIDGTQIGSTGGDYNSGSGQNWIIGDRPGNGQQLNGDIPELILYNRVLTPTEANQVGGYLAQKYGLTTAYPPLNAAVPTGLTTSPLHHGVRLDWATSVGATGYKLKRAAVNGGPYTQIATPTGLTYNDMDAALVDGTTYYYVVSATNSSGESADSAEVSAAPSAGPVNQTITFALGSALSKTAIAPAFADVAAASSGLTVEYSSDNTAVATVDASGTVTLAGITGTAHILANQAGNADFNAAPQVSQTLTVTKEMPVITWNNPATIGAGTPLSETQLNATSGGVAGEFVYTPPTGTVLAVGAGQILSVQFTPTDTATYEIPAAKTVTITVATIVTSASTTLNMTAAGTGAEILNTGVLVAANHFGGVSDGMSAPAAVTLANGLTFGTSLTHMTSGWTPVHSSSSWSSAASITNAPFKALMSDTFWIAYGSSVSYLNIPGLTPGHTYRLQLISVQPQGCGVSIEGNAPVTWSGNNTVLSATWLQSPGDTTANIILTRTGGEINFNAYALHDMSVAPLIPTGLAATPLLGQILLNWTPSGGATSYNVKRAEISNGPYTTIGSPATNAFTDFSVTDGVTYYYVVSAVNSAGESADSTEVSATPAVTQVDQTISFTLGTALTKTAIDSAFADLATATSGLPVTYTSSDETVATVDASGTVTLQGKPGTISIFANQAGNFAYHAAPQVEQVLTVNQALPVITWSNPAAIPYGTALSATELNATSTAPGTFVYDPLIDTVLAVGSHTLSVQFTPDNTIAYSTPAAKSVTLVVGSADGPAVINVNYAGGPNPGNAWMNGRYSFDTAATGSASRVAPAVYGGNTWNDFSSNTASGSALKDSKGAVTTVGLTTSCNAGPWNDWTALGSNRMLVSAVLAGYTVPTPIITLSGLNPGHTYDLYIASALNSENHPADFAVGATTLHLANPPTVPTDWMDGKNFVHFTGLSPNASGVLVVNASCGGAWNGIVLNGFQLIDLGSGSDYATWASLYPGANLSDPAADLDGDGLSNQQEYAFGLNPTSGASTNPITSPLSGTQFSYTWRATSGLAYTVWYSTDLEHWSWDEHAVQTPQDVPDAFGAQTVLVTLGDASATNGKLFIRVQAQ